VAVKSVRRKVFPYRDRNSSRNSKKEELVIDPNGAIVSPMYEESPNKGENPLFEAANTKL